MEPDTNQWPEPTAQYADHIIHDGCILNLMQEQGFAINYQRLIHFAGAFRLRQSPPLLCPLTWRVCWRPAWARWCREQSSDWPRGRFISTWQKDEIIWINICSCQTPDQPTWDQRSTTKPQGHRALVPTWPNTHLENESLDLPTSYVAKETWSSLSIFSFETKLHPEL